MQLQVTAPRSRAPTRGGLREPPRPRDDPRMDSSRRPGLPLALALAFAVACGGGDDGNDDDTAAGTTLIESTSAAATTTEAATGSSGGGDSTTGFPMECEGLCGEGEICVFLGACSEDPPSCAPADMVICDFESGACSVIDVCSGTLFEGALLCETCG